MNRSANPYRRHRFPPAIIQYAVWLYHRFNLSHRDIEDLLAERGIEVSYESVRLWCNKFGPLFSKRLKRRHPVRQSKNAGCDQHDGRNFQGADWRSGREVNSSSPFLTGIFCN